MSCLFTHQQLSRVMAIAKAPYSLALSSQSSSGVPKLFAGFATLLAMSCFSSVATASYEGAASCYEYLGDVCERHTIRYDAHNESEALDACNKYYERINSGLFPCILREDPNSSDYKYYTHKSLDTIQSFDPASFYFSSDPAKPGAYRLSAQQAKSSCNTQHEPCDVITGRTTKRENDIQLKFIEFTRFYDSGSVDPVTWIGSNWRHNFDVTLDRRLLDRRLPVAPGFPLRMPLVTFTSRKIGTHFSEAFPNKHDACERGWDDIKTYAYQGRFSSATVVFNTANDLCEIHVDREIVAYAPILDAIPSRPQATSASASSHTVSRPDGAFYTFVEEETNPGSYREVNGYDVRLVKIAENEFSFHDTDGSIDRFLNHQMIERTLPNGKVLSIHYDAGGRVERVVNDQSSGQLEFVYNSNGQIESVSHPDGNGGNKTVQYTYDSHYNLSRVDYGNGNFRDYTYLNSNSDFPHHLTSVIDENGKTYVDWEYDSSGRVIRSRHLDQSVTTTLEYSPNSTKVTKDFGEDNTNPDVSHVYVYDFNMQNGRFLINRINSPDTGTTTYEYNSNNKRITMTDSRGVVTHYDYDGLGRLKAVRYPLSPQENITYQYDDTANGNGDNNRLSKVIDASGITAYQYYDDGNISVKTTTLNNKNYRINYYYGLDNNLTQVTYPSGLIVHYDYDAQGRVSNVSTGQSQEDLVSGITYLPFGPAKEMTYGNGLKNTMSYDQDDRLTSLVTSNTNTTTTVVDMAYEYMRGNVSKITDNLDQTQTQTQTQSFDYDSLDRLTKSEGGYGVLTYSYDAMGNIDRLSRQNAIYTYEYGPYMYSKRRLKSIEKNVGESTWPAHIFQYDRSGNVHLAVSLKPDSSDNGSIYSTFINTKTYNDANRLTEATFTFWGTYIYNDNFTITAPPISDGTPTTTANYSYNALGQRTQKAITKDGKTTNTYYLYNEAGQLLSEIRNDGGVRDYIYLNGQVIATQDTTVSQVASNAYYVINKETGLKLRPTDRSDGSAIITAAATEISTWAQYRKVMNGDYFYLENVETGKYFRPIPRDNVNGAGLEQRPSTFTGSRTQWSLNRVDNDSPHYHLVNRDSGAHIRPAVNTVGGKVIQRPSSWTGAWTRWRLEPVLTTEKTTAIYYHHNDHLGAPRVLTDKDQRTVWAANYLPFGEATITTETIENNLRLPGQYFDSESKEGGSNWYYSGDRYYYPSLGRYLSPDPIGITNDYSDPQLQIAIKLGAIKETKDAGRMLRSPYSYVQQSRP